MLVHYSPYLKTFHRRNFVLHSVISSDVYNSKENYRKRNLPFTDSNESRNIYLENQLLKGHFRIIFFKKMGENHEKMKKNPEWEENLEK